MNNVLNRACVFIIKPKHFIFSAATQVNPITTRRRLLQKESRLNPARLFCFKNPCQRICGIFNFQVQVSRRSLYNPAP